MGERLQDWGRAVAQQPLLFLLAVLAGGFAGVAYTSGPLHSAKNWHLDYLDTQLAIQNQRVRDLETALAQRPLHSESALAPAQAAALREELTQAALQRDGQAERADAAEAETAKAARTGDRWKAQFRQAETQLSQRLRENAELARERDGLLARLSALDSHSAPPPAAVGPAVDPEWTVLAEGLELMVGESWSSPDGQVSFDVVDVDKQIASLRGSWQSSAAGPERVSPGHQLTERRDKTVYRIFVSAVSPYRSVTIRATSSPR